MPLRHTLLAGAAGLTLVLAPAAAPAETAFTFDAPGLPTAPVVPVPPILDRAKVDVAVAALDGLVESAMKRTGLPGLALGVVYKDEVVFTKGYGVREVGAPGAIDADTVFMLASVSKPIASTIVARLVGEGKFAFTDPVKKYNPAFALSDPWVTENASFADLLSHRSGLYTGAGDLLEDLGFERDYILSHLDQQPLDTFRESYHYSNFGYTLGGVSAAAAAGMAWEELADELLFKPIGMTSASYRHADYLARPDRARIHFREADGTWVAKYDRDPDAEAPAGGGSASINDMMKFLRLQLADGTFDGTEIVEAEALGFTHLPQSFSAPAHDPAARSGFYGLGWNVSYDDDGRVRIGHSGAFNLGTGTTVLFLPSEDVGIVVLTNGSPIGLAESIAQGFVDIADDGKLDVDWLGFFQPIFHQMLYPPRSHYATAAANAAPAKENAAYEGVYANPYYGPLTVSEVAAGLAMSLGPAGSPVVFPLSHYAGDTFTFESIGENMTGISGAVFTMGPDGKAKSVVLDFYNDRGLGTFVRE